MKLLRILVFLSFAMAFQPQTKEELQTAVDLWVSDEETALETYGEINTWDTSLITDMSYLFHNTSFSGPKATLSHLLALVGIARGSRRRRERNLL